MSLMSRDNHYIVWGGSWAIRRETFQSSPCRGMGRHAQRRPGGRRDAARRAKSEVRFEPACIVASPLDLLFSAHRFIRRQYSSSGITRPLVAAAVFAATFRNAAGSASWRFSAGPDIRRAVAVDSRRIAGALYGWAPAAVGSSRAWRESIFRSDSVLARGAAVRHLGRPRWPPGQWLVLLSTLFGAKRRLAFDLLSRSCPAADRPAVATPNPRGTAGPAPSAGPHRPR